MPRTVDAMNENQADCVTDIQSAISSYSHDLTAIELVGCLQFVISGMMDMTLNANLEDE